MGLFKGVLVKGNYLKAVYIIIKLGILEISTLR